MKRIAVLPTLVTLGNGLCGFVAIAYLMQAQPGTAEFAHHMVRASWLMLAALVFDALDGSVARLTRGSSEFGAQLDSLADVISFGLAPALAVMVMASHVGFLARVGWVTGSLFLACAMMRLARYNVEAQDGEGPTTFFAGLPTPAAGGLIASLVLVHFSVSTEPDLGVIARHLHLHSMMDGLVKFLPVVAILVALLMVSRLPFVHLVNNLLREKEPFDYVVRIVLLILFAFFTWPFSIPLAFSVYLVWGLGSAVQRGIREHVAAVSEGPE